MTSMRAFKASLHSQDSPYICYACRLRAQLPRPRRPLLRRNFRLESPRLRQDTDDSVLSAAQEQVEWSKRAADIKAGRQDSFLTKLERRGLVNQIVGQRDVLDRLLTEQRVGVYLGIDPTASSLHVGHLLPLMALFWMYSHGFPAFSILGNSTATVGDPSGRITEREQQSVSEVEMNAEKIKRQLDLLWLGTEKELIRNEVFPGDITWQRESMSNSSWLEKISFMEMLRLSRGLRQGTMLGRSTIKNKIEKEEPLSWAASWYPVCQALDFWHLYSKKGVHIQIGGSDQFGNILTGLDLIKAFKKTETQETELAQEKPSQTPIGFTIPLLTTASGEKFGKSAGNAVWLDPDLTSPFDLYQFFLGTPDDDVYRYLKLFTFKSLEGLLELMKNHEITPHKRLAQHTLAMSVLQLVHGDEVAEKARNQHSGLFQSAQGSSTNSIREVVMNGLQESFADGSHEQARGGPKRKPSMNMTFPSSKISARSVPQVLLDAGLVSSRSEGKRLCGSNGVYVGVMAAEEGNKFKWQSISSISEEARSDAGKLLIDGDLLFLRTGKTKVRAILVRDEAPE